MREQDYIQKTKPLSQRIGLFVLILLTLTQSRFDASCVENLEARQHVTISSIETPHHADHGCLFDQQKEQNQNAVSVTIIDRDRQQLKRSQYFAAVSLFYSSASSYVVHPIKFLRAVPFDSSWHLFKFTTTLRTTVIIV